MFRPISFHQTRHNIYFSKFLRFPKKGQKSVLKYDLTLLEMILYSFTVIFTSFFQSNIELWIHFFSVDKISCKCEGNVFQKKRLIVTKKKSFFILQKSFSDQKTSSPTKHRSWWCKNFCEHIKTCPSKTLFYLWDKMTKAFFQLIEKFSFFFNGWWNVHPWNRFHGWTLHWRFTKEESVAWTYTTKESFPLSSEIHDNTIYGIDFRTLFISE